MSEPVANHYGSLRQCVFQNRHRYKVIRVNDAYCIRIIYLNLETISSIVIFNLIKHTIWMNSATAFNSCRPEGVSSQCSFVSGMWL